MSSLHKNVQFANRMLILALNVQYKNTQSTINLDYR